MKKTLNIFYAVLAFIGGLWLGVQILLLLILPLDPVQKLVQDEVSRAAGRTVSAQRISVRLSGLVLQNAAVASSAALAKGELFTAREIRLRWNAWHLLHGHIKINSVILKKPQMHIVRHSDGTFNFDGLFGAGQSSAEVKETQSRPFTLDLNVHSLRLTDGLLNFDDEMTDQRMQVSELYFSVNDFSFDRPFETSLNASLLYERGGRPAQRAKVGLTLQPDLKNMDLASASVRLSRVVFKYAGSTFILTGEVKDFNNPSVAVRLNGKNISDKLARFAVADLPVFSLEEAQADVKASLLSREERVDVASFAAQAFSAVVYSSSSAEVFSLPQGALFVSGAAEWGKERAAVSSFTAQGLNSFVSSSGTIFWGSEPAFDLSGVFEADLRALGESSALLKPYRLRGHIGGNTSAQTVNASADIWLAGVGAVLPQVGTLSNFNTRIKLADLKHLRMDKFSGKLNGGVFDGELSALRTPEDVNVDFRFHSPRLALPAANTRRAGKPKPASSSAQTAHSAAKAALPPFNIKAYVDIASLDAPYIWGENIVFSADLQQLTSSLEKAHGELILNTGKGEIKDLNRLTNANLLTKVMFGSLGAVSKVINSLNVFAVLNGLGSGMVSAVSGKEEKPANMVVQTVKDENGHDMQILVPYTEQKVDGKLAFELFSTDVAFTHGEAEVKKGAFVSDLMSFNLTGDMNFKTQALDMKVNAAPGRHYEDGIMPLTITIGGTLEDPKGSMSMTSSLTSLVTQGVANNFASRTVKKTLGGLFGLFKKKPKEEKPASAQSEPPVLDAEPKIN